MRERWLPCKLCSYAPLARSGKLVTSNTQWQLHLMKLFAASKLWGRNLCNSLLGISTFTLLAWLLDKCNTINFFRLLLRDDGRCEFENLWTWPGYRVMYGPHYRDEATQSQIYILTPNSPLSDCNNNRYVASGQAMPGDTGPELRSRALGCVHPPLSPALYSLQHGPKLPSDKLKHNWVEYSVENSPQTVKQMF